MYTVASQGNHRARFLGGEVDVAIEDGDKDILIPTSGFNSAGNSTDEEGTV